jgi:hypothetical protein
MTISEQDKNEYRDRSETRHVQVYGEKGERLSENYISGQNLLFSGGNNVQIINFTTMLHFQRSLPTFR